MKFQAGSWILKRILAGMMASWFLLGANAVPDSLALVEVLDVDSDGVVDFELREGFLTTPRVGPDCPSGLSAVIGLYGVGDNRILVDYQFACMNGARRLLKGDPIPAVPAALTAWESDAELRLSGGNPAAAFYDGPYASETNGYLGLSFRSGGVGRLGWVRIGSATLRGNLRILEFGTAVASDTLTFAGGTPPPVFPGTIPIQVPPDRTSIGTIQRSRTTNQVSGVISWELKLQVNDPFRCLSGAAQPDWPQNRYPVALTERSVLPNPLPAAWTWSSSSGEFLLSSGSQTANGTILGEVGPFLGRTSVMIGLRDATGNCWWVEVARSGDVTYVGYSSKAYGEQLVGAPYGANGADGWYDLNGDGLVDFVHWEEFKGPYTTRHFLQPMRGNFILKNTLLKRVGTSVGAKPVGADSWSDQPILLFEHKLHAEGPAQPYWEVIQQGVLAGLFGHVAVQFQIENRPHHGWIQFNQYVTLAPGMFGNLQLTPPSLDFHDFGYQHRPGEPVVVGLESSIFPKVQVFGGELRVTWPGFNSRTKLERTSALDTPVWEAAATTGFGVHKSPLDPGRGQGFFRLVTPLPFPETVIQSPGLPFGRPVSETGYSVRH